MSRNMIRALFLVAVVIGCALVVCFASANQGSTP